MMRESAASTKERAGEMTEHVGECIEQVAVGDTIQAGHMADEFGIRHMRRRPARRHMQGRWRKTLEIGLKRQRPMLVYKPDK